MDKVAASGSGGPRFEPRRLHLLVIFFAGHVRNRRSRKDLSKSDAPSFSLGTYGSVHLEKIVLNQMEFDSRMEVDSVRTQRPKWK